MQSLEHSQILLFSAFCVLFLQDIIPKLQFLMSLAVKVQTCHICSASPCTTFMSEPPRWVLGTHFTHVPG